MADGELAILIKAVDEMSGVLNDVSMNLDKLANKSQDSSEKMNSAWENSTTGLLALGNIASSVDRIFSDFTNLQIRLENATERLANAQDRVADANDRVAKATKEVTKYQDGYNFALEHQGLNSQYAIDQTEKYLTAQDNLQQALKEQERANRGLTISQNNLERANNQVIGTYINMGTQGLTAAASTAKLGASFGLTGVAAAGATVAIAGVAAGLYLAYQQIMNNQPLHDAFIAAWEKLKDAFTKFMIAIEPLKPVLAFIGQLIGYAIVGAINLLADVLTGVTIIFKGWMIIIDNVIERVKTLIDWVKELIANIGRIAFGAFSGGGRGGSVTNVGDAIMRPDGSVIQTDPRDTLVAMKDVDASVGGMGGGPGYAIYIENVYGVDPQQISQAIREQLFQRLSY